MKHIIFDFDGTLADSTAVFASVWNTIAKKHGFKEVQLEDIDALKKRYTSYLLYSRNFIAYISNHYKMFIYFTV